LTGLADDEAVNAAWLHGWRRPSWRSPTAASRQQAVDKVTVDVPGIYVIYSKITFGCQTKNENSSRSQSHLHRIYAMDGRGGRWINCLLTYLLIGLYYRYSNFLHSVSKTSHLLRAI